MENWKCTINHNTNYTMEEKTESLRIVGLITFIGDSARGILSPSLWPLCQSLGGSQLHLGALVASFSLGRLVMTNPIGFITDRYRHRWALILCSALLCAGALIWSLCGLLRSIAVLYVAQLLLGFGSGSLGTTRSFVVEQTLPKDRTIALSRFAALQYAGFAGTPLLGSILLLGSSSTFPYGIPALILTVCAMINLRLLFTSFHNIEEIADLMIRNERKEIASSSAAIVPIVPPPTKSEERVTVVSPLFLVISLDEEKQQPPPPVAIEKPVLTPAELPNQASSSSSYQDQLIFFLFITLNFTTRGGIAVYETQISRILLTTYGLSSIEYGLIMSCSGTLGVIQLLYFESFWCQLYPTNSAMNDVLLMYGGICITAISQIWLIGWTYDTTIPLWAMILTVIIIYGIGYPISNTAVLGGYSKLMKMGKKQGKYQAMFAFVGSLSRIVLPLLSSVFERYVEPNSSFNMVMILMCVSLIGIGTLYQEISHTGSKNSSNHKEIMAIKSPLHDTTTTDHKDNNNDREKKEKEKEENKNKNIDGDLEMMIMTNELPPREREAEEEEEVSRPKGRSTGTGKGRKDHHYTSLLSSSPLTSSSSSSSSVSKPQPPQHQEENDGSALYFWNHKLSSLLWWQWLNLVICMFFIILSLGSMADWGNKRW